MRSMAFRAFIAQGKFMVPSPNSKSFFLAGLLDIAFEQHRALCLLLMYGMSSSAFALLRTFIETSYRAIWLQTCAPEKTVKKITETTGDGFPDISRIITDLVNKSGIHEFRTHLPNLSLLNDFTHTGSIQIVRRFQMVHKKSSCFEQDVLICLGHADHVLLILALLFYGTYGENPHVQEIQARFMALLGSYEIPESI
jgi:hypothetical protein